MGEDTCARAKVLPKREARNLLRVLVAPHFCSHSGGKPDAFLLPLTPRFPSLKHLLPLLMLVI